MEKPPVLSSSAERSLTLLFSTTLFVSAGLLFCVQPLIAKMILPLLGGVPAVWNTCMVFFQAELLVGYLYAYFVTRWLGARGQTCLHLLLLALPLLVLPISLPRDLVDAGPGDVEPVFWQLRLLLLTTGLPFFVVATSAPLLQKWFAGTGTVSGRDPYFLYAASNLGSMVALLAYPFVLETSFDQEDQAHLWHAGYGLLFALTAGCAIAVWRAPPVTKSHFDSLPSLPSDSPSVARRLRWVALTLVPSSALLGVTTFITTDLASIPLLWVMPLALYLLSFILVFARRPLIPHGQMLRLFPVTVLLGAIVLLDTVILSVAQLISFTWIILFVVAMVCHGELAADRPTSRYLTEFYLWMSLGGVLGGAMNALLAPVVFRTGIVEYPLALVLACLLLPARDHRDGIRLRVLDLLLPVGVATLTWTLITILRAISDEPTLLGTTVMFVILTVVCYSFTDRPLRFGLAVGAMMLTVNQMPLRGGRTLFAERNFFGVVRVQDESDGRFRGLVHGNTVHGRQRLTPDGRPEPNAEPLSYYHPTGPAGEIFSLYNRRAAPDYRPKPHEPSPLPARVAVAGLGIGTLAAYAKPGQDWTFYEIDPTVILVAKDPKFFTYLTDSRASAIRIRLGDARLQLKNAEEKYGLIVLDAFSSDSIPVHLLSLQALDLYLSKLAPGGILAFHISNRYLELEPLLGDLAGARPPLVCYCWTDTAITPEEDAKGKGASQWVVMARAPADLGNIPHEKRWERIEPRPDARVWTDGFSDVLRVVRWR